MTETEDGRHIGTHVYLEDAPIGEYVGRLQIRDFDVDAGTEVSSRNIELSMDALERLRTHIDGTLDRLHARRLADAVAGDCELCSNSRMVYVRRHDREMQEHCPRCTPKLQEAGLR